MESEILDITPSINTPKKVTKKDESKFFTFPNSPASNSMLNVVTHAGNLETFAARLEDNSHSTKLDFFTPPEGSKAVDQRVRYTTGNLETTIHLDNIDVFSKAKKPLKKLLTYTLIKAAKEKYDVDSPHDFSIKFPLEDFVELGCYKNIVTARQAFNQAKGPLTSIKIEGVVRDIKDMQQITDSGIEVLFTGAHIKKGIVEIFLNRRINWQIFALQYFSILPKSYFTLSDNAADILLNVFMIARKRLNDIGSKGSYTVSFKTLQQILDLPDENKTKNPSRDIKEPILSALNEVMEVEKDDIFIEAVYNANANIIDFLENGYAKISLNNEYLEYFEKLARTKTSKIEQTMKRREDIKKIAAAKELSKKKQDSEADKE